MGGGRRGTGDGRATSTTMNVTCYRDLEVWQLGIKLTKQVYELTRTFPKHELYAL